ELKTPLTSIAGYAETLAAEAAESEAKRFAETILANATRMQRLVDDLLDLSRIESGGWQPAPAVLDVATAARDAFTPLADRAAAGGVRFEAVVPAEAAHVVADPEALREIFTNLFDNALRHTPRGGRLRVTADRVAGRPAGHRDRRRVPAVPVPDEESVRREPLRCHARLRQRAWSLRRRHLDADHRGHLHQHRQLPRLPHQVRVRRLHANRQRHHRE